MSNVDELVARVYERAKADPQTILFPEADDPKMMKAAYETATGGYGRCVLVGDETRLREVCRGIGADEGVFTYVDVADEALRDALVARYVELPHALFDAESVAFKMREPLYFALVMQAVGEGDVTIGGLSATTGEVIQATWEIIGMADDADLVSSMSLCDIPGFEGSEGSLLGVADIAVTPNPDASELASIAIASCDTLRAITGWEPRCAMLSFSTDGSASHDLVDKVVEATHIAQERRPDLLIDGEFQCDVAIDPASAAKKLDRPSEVAGRANLLVFPDLNAGNIGAKILNKIAGAQFFGVFMQGFRQICTDSARSASVPELVRNIVFSAVRAQDLKAGRGTA